MNLNNEAGPSTRNDMVIPDNEHYQNMIRARVAMEKNTQMVIAENQTYRPVNTTVAYTAKQNEWFVSFVNIFSVVTIILIELLL